MVEGRPTYAAHTQIPSEAATSAHMAVEKPSMAASATVEAASANPHLS